jgi:hypothetical protein
MKTELHVLELVDGKRFTCRIVERPDRIVFAECYDAFSGDERSVVGEWLETLEGRYRDDPRPIEYWSGVDETKEFFRSPNE